MAVFALVLVLQVPLAELCDDYKRQLAKADWEGVGRAARAIGHHGTQEAADFLDRELENATRTSHRISLFRARAFMRVPRQIEFLQDRIGAAEPYFRAIALEAMAQSNRSAARKRAITLIEVDEDPRVRRAAMQVLAELKGPGVGLAMVKAAVHLPPAEQARVVRAVQRLDAADLMGVDELALDPDVRMRKVAVLAISGAAAPRFRHILEKARKDLDPGVALAAAAGLDRIKTPGRSSSVRAILAKVHGFEERWDLFDLVSRMRLRDPSLFKMVATACTHGDPWLRPKAAETLGYLGGDDAVAILAPLALKKKPWQIALGAARGLGAARTASAVEPLIAALRNARGRVAHEAATSLESITGQPFGLNWRMWEYWWTHHKHGYVVPETIEARWEEPKAVRDRYHFYGVEIRSEAVSFLLDVSGSMSGERIAKLKKELRAAVKAMPSTTYFNLITFDSGVRRWSRSLTQAKLRGKESAIEFVEGLQANGATNLYGALQMGLSDDAVDTIVILSDGEPTAGKITDMATIRAEFLELNRKRMVLLNAIVLNHQSKELKTMALTSGGTYKEK